MARKPLQIDSSELNFATALTPNNGKLHKAALLKINKDGSIDESSKTFGIFQINPATWEENKNSNWVGHNIPGQSDPVYQWISGGPRTLSFEALVTKDSAYFEKLPPNPLAGLAQDAVNVIGGIASAMSGLDVNALAASTIGFFSTPDPNSKLSIANELNYYRSLLYPEYKTGVIERSPPLLILYAGSTFSSFGYLAESTIDSSIHVWVLTNLKIQVTKQLPNLSPMEAYVSFQLTQYTTAPFSSSQFTTGATQSGQNSNSGGLLQTISGFLGF
jgi:hypothetical protein